VRIARLLDKAGSRVDNVGVSAKPHAEAKALSDLQARVEGERAGRPFLLYRNGDDSQRLFFFAPDAMSASVGREAPADLLLDWDGQVSRLHARFERVDDDWDLIDDGLSRNGTFLNDQRLSGRRRLKDGDTLRFGTTTVTFRSPQPEQPDAPDAPGTASAVSLSTTQRRVLVALCRPYSAGTRFAGPASDEQIADELFLSAGVVRTHLRVLYAKLGVEQLSQAETRVRLVERAFSAGLISERDL
jgi:FHA domain/Bacterial regulatory proteins, luxR family